MGAIQRLIRGRAAVLRVDQRVIHCDIGEVTITEIDGRHVRIRDEEGQKAWVPASEIC